MKRKAVPCEIGIERDRPTPKPQLGPNGEPLPDALNFALNWPLYPIVFASNGEDLSYQEMMQVGRATYLPPEIMAMIISRTLVALPQCAVNLVVPDWGVCQRETPEIEKLLGITRIVSYIRDFDPNSFALNVELYSEYTRQSYCSHTHVFTLGTSHIPSGMLEEILGSDLANHPPFRSQRLKFILPFDDQPSHVVERRAGLSPVPLYRYLRHIAVYSPLELMQMTADNPSSAADFGRESKTEALDHAFDLDRSAQLWLSWSQMPNLESVFLDLRIYSHDLNTKRRCLSKFQVIDRAREMGRHLQLRTLMLAGLQSYSFHAAYQGVTARDIEEWDLLNGEPNWVKIFRPAIRGGGKIVLVDRLTDLISWTVQ